MTSNSFNLPPLPPLQRTGMAGGDLMASFLDNQESIDSSAVAAFVTALAVLPTIAAAANAHVAASAPAPLANKEASQIKFTPTINGKHPANPESLHPKKVDFENQESAEAHLEALKRVHKKIIRALKAQSVFDSSISSQSAEKYNNGILGNRYIEPVTFAVTVKGDPFHTARCAYTADLHSPTDAYSYTRRLVNAHEALLKRASERNAVLQNAAAPVAAAQAGQSDLAPPATSASVDTPVAAIEFDEKESDYSIKKNFFDNGENVIVEKWLKGHGAPPTIPNGFEPQTYDIGTHMLRITTILAPNSAVAPESPSSPLSAASLTPPRSPLPAQNGAAVPSYVTETVEGDLGDGIVNVMQTWPVGKPDPDLPDGYLTTISEEQVGEWMMRRSTCNRGGSS